MPRPATGRPAGRPKTKEYATILARVPQNLADQVKDYAEINDTSISALIREGLEWRLQAGLAHKDGAHNRNTPLPQQTITTVQEQAVLLQRLAQTLARSADTLLTISPGDTSSSLEEARLDKACVDYSNTGIEFSAYNSNTEVEQRADTGAYPGNASVEHEEKSSNTVLQEDVPPFDLTKYVLGKLCPRGHEHRGTGLSLLRRTNRHCLACDREKFHERKQARQEARPPQKARPG